MFRRRLKLLGKILLALILLLVVFLLFERFRGRISLAHYKRELIGKGEKLTAQEVMDQRPKGENGLPDVLAAHKRLKTGLVMPNCYPPAMRLTPSGRAIVGFQLESWMEGKITNRWEQLALELNENSATLAEIRAALTKPVLDNNMDLSQGAKMTFPSLVDTKSLTHWFRSECLLALHEGRPADAAVPLVAQIRLPKALIEDRIAISEMVRFVMGSIATTATWEALQSDGWRDADLTQIQSAWVEQEFMSSLARSLEGERAYALSIYAALYSSNDDAFDLVFGMEDYLSMFGDDSGDSWLRGKMQKLPGYESLIGFLQRNIFCRIWRFAWLDQDECRYLQRMQTLIEAAREAAKMESLVSVQHTIASLEQAQEDFGFYDNLRFPMQRTFLSLTRLLEKAARVELDRSLSLSAIAIKRYALRHGKMPATLNVLVPDFLASVPVDYMDGKPIKYHLNDDGSFVLYSVGEDGRDDGGDLTPPAGSKSKDLWRRRDYVWPAPALPEEVEAYRKESAK